jgi:hypothetical protein
MVKNPHWRRYCCTLPFIIGYPKTYSQGFSSSNLSNTIKSNTIKQERIEKLFDERAKRYDERLGKFNTNMQLQAIFIISSIVILVKNSEKINILIIGMEISVNLLYFVIPFSLLYLWLQFGFLLDNLIGDQIIGWGILDALQDPEQKNILSARSLLKDGAFVDGWFLLFADGFHNMITNFKILIGLLFIIIYGSLLGFTHACILSLLHIWSKKFSKKYDTIKFIKYVLHAVVWIALMIIVLSHIIFSYGGSHRNWFQFCIAFFTILYTYVLLWLEYYTDLAESGV